MAQQLPGVMVALLLACVSARASTSTRTGEPFRFKPAPAGGPEMVHYWIDWGDGTLSPTAHGRSRFSPVVEKVWTERGDYEIRSFAVTLSGTTIPLAASRVSVRGPAIAPAPALGARRFAQNEPDGLLLDQPNPDSAVRPYFAQGVGLLFDRMMAVETLVLRAQRGSRFPAQFSVEYITDGEGVWHDIPAAVFQHVPDPGENEIHIPLHGIAARAVRVVSYDPPRQDDESFALRLGRIEARGSETFLFEMDADPRTVAAWNNLWLTYGSAENEIHHDFVGYPHPTDRPDEGGMLMIGSTIWAHWNSMKLAWLDDLAAKRYFERTVNLYPQDEQGLLGVSPGSFLHLDHSRHYVTPAIFICGLAHWFLTHRDPAFLEMRDAESGATLLEKMRKAMEFQLDVMNGRSGVMTIVDPEHDGTPQGKPSNYWDVWRFGYKSAYANLWFYQSIDWMARLERALGNEERAVEFKSLQGKVRERFSELFWNPQTGRFIGWQCIQGSRQDFGFTWVNLEAVAAGVAVPAHARSILDWLDGARRVPSDTSTGSDIYFWRVAPRANTLAAEANPAYWDTWTMQIGPGTMGEYGGQIQNGGHIFYVSYYDLMSRLKTRGIDDAMRRMRVILDEFNQDQLRRKPGNRLGSTHVEGILREFPESGLVPLFFVTGILGIEPDAEGLRIEPALPSEWSFAAVNAYAFAGRRYRIRVERGLPQPVVRGEQVTLPAEGRWRLTPDATVEEIR